MKLIFEPTVRLIAATKIREQELAAFFASHQTADPSDSTSDAERLVETAGRLCYMSFANPRPGGTKAYLDHIRKVGHGSVLEHATWTFLIEGVSRSLTHELVRHRAGFGFSQLSQRYVDESVAEYIEPGIIAEDPELHAIWVKAVGQVQSAYVELASKLYLKLDGSGMDYTSRRKAARQAARSVLPNATETKIVVTANARAWRHFIEMRVDTPADPEIRQLGWKIHEALAADAPLLFGDYQPGVTPHTLKTETRKV